MREKGGGGGGEVVARALEKFKKLRNGFVSLWRSEEKFYYEKCVDNAIENLSKMLMKGTGQ